MVFLLMISFVFKKIKNKKNHILVNATKAKIKINHKLF